jgi:hypothetical protein
MATGYINYDFDGKKIRIPKEEIERNMSIPIVKTEEDAIWIWLEDNGYVDNPEQNELDQKAKDNRITATIHQARAENTQPRKKVERKADETKESIIASLAECLAEIVENVQVINVGKLIEFDLKGEHYKLDLIRQRKPKK